MQSYPLNAENLNKGDTIASETIAEFLGLPVNHRLYKLKALALAKKIAGILDERGKPATVVVTRTKDAIGPGGIRVLTDEEAVSYNPRQYRSGLRRAVRSHKRLLHTDASQLTSDGRKTFERELVVQGSVLAAVASTRARAVLKVAQRTTPPMIENKSE